MKQDLLTLQSLSHSSYNLSDSPVNVHDFKNVVSYIVFWFLVDEILSDDNIAMLV